MNIPGEPTELASLSQASLAAGRLARVRERIAELRNARHKATHGIWRVECVSNAVRIVIGNGRQKLILARANTPQLPEKETTANMQFCVEAARSMPHVIDLLEALLDERAKAHGPSGEWLRAHEHTGDVLARLLEVR